MTDQIENHAFRKQPCDTIRVEGLELGYGNFIVLKDLEFSISPQEIFVIMGGSGCGKSTLLKHLTGLMIPKKGTITIQDMPFDAEDEEMRQKILKRVGVLFQGGALWSSMTLFENVSLPLELHTRLSHNEIREIVMFKLAMVGLDSWPETYPSELSGGMRKRAGLARAMALDPDILFFDEPGAGLDPISSRRLDDLILEMSESMHTTIVVVTHELSSIFAIGTDGIFLDADSKTGIAHGSPKHMLDTCMHTTVQRFLNRKTNLAELT